MYVKSEKIRDLSSFNLNNKPTFYLFPSWTISLTVWGYTNGVRTAYNTESNNHHSQNLTYRLTRCCKCIIGLEKKDAWDRNKLHLTWNFRYQANPTDRDFSIVTEMNTNQVRNQEAHDEGRKWGKERLKIKGNGAEKTRKQKGFACTKSTRQVSGGYHVLFNQSTLGVKRSDAITFLLLRLSRT
jgi:hypothetical protein